MESCKRALEEAHVALTHGIDFGEGGAGEYVRLSFATSISELNDGLARLERFVRQVSR